MFLPIGLHQVSLPSNEVAPPGYHPIYLSNGCTQHDQFKFPLKITSFIAILE